MDVSDGSGRPDPVKDVEVINGELVSFGAKLEEKPVIMVASKIDVANKDKLAKLKRYCKKQGLELFAVSAVTGKGIEDLIYAMAEKVEEAKKNPQAPVLAVPQESAESQTTAANTGQRTQKKLGGHCWPPISCLMTIPIKRVPPAMKHDESGIAESSPPWPCWPLSRQFPDCGRLLPGKPLRPPTIRQFPPAARD